MGKWLAVLAFVSLGGQILTGRADAQPRPPERTRREADPDVERFVKSFSEPIQIKESKPVTVKDAKFVLVAQTNWNRPKFDKDFPTAAEVEVQLHITNLSKGDLRFPTFGAFGVRVFTADGKEVKPRVEGKGDNDTRPIVLPAGASFALSRRAELRYDEKKAVELAYYDGTGAESVFGPLEPGKYRLAFWYSVPPERQKPKEGDAPTWVGEVVTEEVPVELSEEFTRGISRGKQRLTPLSDPVRIGESKPVTEKDAEFVVVAQSEWKCGRYQHKVPVDIQLRITNAGKSDLIFPTFDTFLLMLKDADGNMVPLLGGGRDGTVLTRPILLPPGASYVLGSQSGKTVADRRAELDWDEDAKAPKLNYWDGTGSWFVYGPLRPGRYKLVFRYAVSSEGPLKTERAPATWLGRVRTEEVTVEVLAR